MDGLVLDTWPGYHSAWQQAASELGFDLDDSLCLTLAGRHRDDVENDLIRAFGKEFSLTEFSRLGSDHWRAYVNRHGIAVKPGFHRLHEILQHRDIPFCLATNSNRKNAEMCLHLAGLPGVFPIMVTRDQVTQGKPAPDLFEEAARRLEFPTGSCLTVEDSHTGIIAASRAGTLPIMIPDRQNPTRDVLNKAYCRLDSLHQLAALIEAV